MGRVDSLPVNMTAVLRGQVHVLFLSHYFPGNFLALVRDVGKQKPGVKQRSDVPQPGNVLKE